MKMVFLLLPVFHWYRLFPEVCSGIRIEQDQSETDIHKTSLCANSFFFKKALHTVFDEMIAKASTWKHQQQQLPWEFEGIVFIRAG